MLSIGLFLFGGGGAFSISFPPLFYSVPFSHSKVPRVVIANLMAVDLIYGLVKSRVLRIVSRPHNIKLRIALEPK